MSESIALIALFRGLERGNSRRSLTEEILEEGSAWGLLEKRRAATLIPSSDLEDALILAARDLEEWQAQGWKFLTIFDEEYPSRVREIHEAPPFLFSSGSLLPNDRGVAVVGSRNASPRGLAMAEAISSALARRGLTVVSGLAKGIDAAAHSTALKESARTVAVIGTGISKSYPAENIALQREILTKGLVLSQFWPDDPPRSFHFPQRNATMSGYSYATIVVEAGENSGARIQARMAVAHGRPVILSDLVVDRTKWGKSLEGRPGVYVARSLAQTMENIDEIMNQDLQNEELLREVAGHIL